MSMPSRSRRCAQPVQATFRPLCSRCLPQVLPQIVSYNLYWFEVGVRSATVLGMIGAGGIGFELVTAIRLYEFRQTSAILLVILALVTLIDQASALIRRSIIR